MVKRRAKPKAAPQSLNELQQIDRHIFQEELKFFQDSAARTACKSPVIPPDCIPINADVRTFDFTALTRAYLQVKGQLFDVIMMDPPWQLSGSAPTRGVTISYSALPDQFISALPVPQLQVAGFLFIWTINAKYRMTLKLFDKWGYTHVDEVVWVKKTCKNKIAKSHGYWLQHAKETCLIGVKGDVRAGALGIPDVIFSLRRGQSQKPQEIYEMIEQLVPGGCYLEVFGRRNNLRDGWVTLGNEI